MRQQLLDFLGDYADTYCSRIEEGPNGVFVYGTWHIFSMSALSSLIEFAKRHGYHYYVSTFLGEVRFRIYQSKES